MISIRNVSVVIPTIIIFLVVVRLGCAVFTKASMMLNSTVAINEFVRVNDDSVIVNHIDELQKRLLDKSDSIQYSDAKRGLAMTNFIKIVQEVVNDWVDYPYDSDQHSDYVVKYKVFMRLLRREVATIKSKDLKRGW